MANKKTIPKAKKVETPTKTSVLTVPLNALLTAEMEKIKKNLDIKTSTKAIESMIESYLRLKRQLGDLQMSYNALSNNYDTIMHNIERYKQIDYEITEQLQKYLKES